MIRERIAHPGMDLDIDRSCDHFLFRRLQVPETIKWE